MAINCNVYSSQGVLCSRDLLNPLTTSQVDPAGKFPVPSHCSCLQQRFVSWLQHGIPEGEPRALTDVDSERMMGD